MMIMSCIRYELRVGLGLPFGALRAWYPAMASASWANSGPSSFGAQFSTPQLGTPSDEKYI
jgi:hypothetical protein